MLNEVGPSLALFRGERIGREAHILGRNGPAAGLFFDLWDGHAIRADLPGPRERVTLRLVHSIHRC